MAKKSKTTTIRDRADLESVAGEFAAQILERDRLTIDMELKIQEIRAAYEPQIAACVETGNGLFEDMQAYALLHPEVFGDRRSIELLHGTVGFRTSPPAVKQIPGVKVEHTIAAIGALGWSHPLIRIKTELDKSAVLIARTSPADGFALTDEDLARIGLRIEQAETFYVDPKREDAKGGQ